jgi:hypothetical protein
MNKSLVLTCILLLAAGGLAFQVFSSYAPREARSRSLSSADRQFLRVCAPRSTLIRRDLDEIALRYKVIKSERSDIDAMLEANSQCRVGNQEQLDFRLPRCEAQRLNGDCPNGILLVPIR